MFIYLPQVVDSYKICRSQHSKFNLCVISFVQCLIRYLLVWGLYLPPVFKGSGDNHESIASFFLPSLCAFYFIVCCLSIKIFPIRFSYYVDDFALRTVISENINLKIIRRVHAWLRFRKPCRVYHQLIFSKRLKKFVNMKTNTGIGTLTTSGGKAVGVNVSFIKLEIVSHINCSLLSLNSKTHIT